MRESITAPCLCVQRSSSQTCAWMKRYRTFWDRLITAFNRVVPVLHWLIPVFNRWAVGLSACCGIWTLVILAQWCDQPPLQNSTILELKKQITYHWMTIIRYNNMDVHTKVATIHVFTRTGIRFLKALLLTVEIN